MITNQIRPVSALPPRYQVKSSKISPSVTENQVFGNSPGLLRTRAASFNTSDTLARAQKKKKKKKKKKRGSAIPSKLTSYSLTATGTTLAGSTAFPGPGTRYSPLENFSLPGVLSVEPKIANSTFNNGNNFRDVGLFVGNQPPFIGPVADFTAGALWFATNNKIFRRLGGNFGQESALDIAFVKGNAKKGTIKIQIDSDTTGNPARIVQLNTFNTRSSLFTSPKQVLGGQMTLKFRNNGRRVSGKVSFAGGGLIEPGAYGYVASFKGKRINLFK